MPENAQTHEDEIDLVEIFQKNIPREAGDFSNCCFQPYFFPWL